MPPISKEFETHIFFSLPQNKDSKKAYLDQLTAGGLYIREAGESSPTLSEPLHFVSFRAVEGFDKIRIDVGNAVMLRNISETLTVKATFQIESEYGRLVTVTKDYSVAFNSWDNPTITELKDIHSK